jgi:hypothetical protein
MKDPTNLLFYSRNSKKRNVKRVYEMLFLNQNYKRDMGLPVVEYFFFELRSKYITSCACQIIEASRFFLGETIMILAVFCNSINSYQLGRLLVFFFLIH